MDLDKALLVSRKIKRELAELDVLERKVRSLVMPDVKLLSAIAARREKLRLDEVLKDVAVNEAKK